LIGGVRRCGRIASLQYLMDSAFSRLHILRSWLGDRLFAMSGEELIAAILGVSQVDCGVRTVAPGGTA
jgi:hypothetical protein